ncbi:hypothetical protein JTE90_009315, partial [Oedothorax gibbosus]
ICCKHSTITPEKAIKLAANDFFRHHLSLVLVNCRYKGK